MALSLREYRARIKSTESMKKITRAMELIAASRIIKAQQRAQAAAPYARELTRAVSAVATYSNVDHPLTTRAGGPEAGRVLIVTSDRGLAGAYSSSVLKEAERLAEKLRGEGKEVDTYVCRPQGRGLLPVPPAPGRASRGPGSPTSRRTTCAREIGEALIDGLPAEDTGERARGVDEVHVVYTRFRSMLVQEPTAIRLLPLEVVEGEEKPAERRGAAALRVRAVGRARCSTRCCRSTSRAGSSSPCCRRPPPSWPPARRR